MALIRLDIPIGFTDGLNKTFYTIIPYVPGTVTVYRNGLATAAAQEDGFVETSSTSGRIDLKIAPQKGDTIQVLYSEVYTVTTASIVIQGIRGKIKATGSLKGRIAGPVA